jgi:hypothetical protein
MPLSAFNCARSIIDVAENSDQNHVAHSLYAVIVCPVNKQDEGIHRVYQVAAQVFDNCYVRHQLKSKQRGIHVFHQVYEKHTSIKYTSVLKN